MEIIHDARVSSLLILKYQVIQNLSLQTEIVHEKANLLGEKKGSGNDISQIIPSRILTIH